MQTNNSLLTFNLPTEPGTEALQPFGYKFSLWKILLTKPVFTCHPLLHIQPNSCRVILTGGVFNDRLTTYVRAKTRIILWAFENKAVSGHILL